jgi:two-component system chemotaxis sensor kinase CheA
VIEHLGRKVGLMIDEVVAQQQVVIKGIGEGIGEARFLSGAAILPNGNVALIVNVDEICSVVRAATPATAATPLAEPEAAPAFAERPQSAAGQSAIGGVR